MQCWQCRCWDAVVVALALMSDDCVLSLLCFVVLARAGFGPVWPKQ
jgi:hypothetical protein